ncbi:MAG: class I SAM-dependent methyltransferase [Halobacteriales archaeon]|nr:class I SAM-dependent methyltransferase [Halobacteriales archaeon]
MDLAPLPGVDIVHDLLDFPWPFKDRSFGHIYCSHVLEHVPHYIGNGQRKDGLILVMEEMHRILRPGGTVTIVAPHHRGDNRWIDPTHTRAIHPGNFAYFDPTLHPQEDYYSTARFRTLDFEVTYWSYRGVGVLPIGKKRHGLFDHLRWRLPFLAPLLRSEPMEVRVRLKKFNPLETA